MSSRDLDSLLIEVSECLRETSDDLQVSSVEDNNSESIPANSNYLGDRGGESGIAELEAVLEQYRESLRKFEAKERFVSARMRRYRGLMEQLSKHADLNSELGQMNEIDTEDQMHSRQDQYFRDSTMLRSVEKVHKDIIAETEILRRRIKELEEKRYNYMQMREECQEFVVAVATAL